jgi:hypothetical protein
MSFKNIKSNLSPKARMILLTVGVLTFGSIWAMYNALSSEDKDPTSVISGGISINNDNTTVKDRGDKQDLLPKDSVQQQEIDALEKKEKEDKKNKGSFMEQLELNNDAKVLTEIEKSLASSNVETGVDDVTDKLRERSEKAARLIERQDRAKDNNQGGTRTNGQGSVNSQRGQYSQTVNYIPQPFDEKAFMDAELNRIKLNTSVVNGSVSNIVYLKTDTVTLLESLMNILKLM